MLTHTMRRKTEKQDKKRNKAPRMIWSKSGQTHKERRNTEIQNENEEMRPEYSGANLGELIQSHGTPKDKSKTKKGAQNILAQIWANS